MKTSLIAFAGLFIFSSVSAFAKPKVVPCALKFSITTKDMLGNVDNGLLPDDEKWLEKTLTKHYEGMCYTAEKTKTKVLFLISIAQETEEDATAMSSTNIRIHPVAVPVYTLKIISIRDDKSAVVRTFQRTKNTSSTGGAVGGAVRIMNNIQNPERQVILDAIDWIANSNVDLSTEPEKVPTNPGVPPC